MTLYEIETLAEKHGAKRHYRLVRRTNTETGKQILQVRTTLHGDTRERVFTSWVADEDAGLEVIEVNDQIDATGWQASGVGLV